MPFLSFTEKSYTVLISIRCKIKRLTECKSTNYILKNLRHILKSTKFANKIIKQRRYETNEIHPRAPADAPHRGADDQLRRRAGDSHDALGHMGGTTLDGVLPGPLGRLRTDLLHGVSDLKNKVTVIIIGHRLQTLKNADELIYLQQGKLVDNEKIKDKINYFSEIIEGERSI